MRSLSPVKETQNNDQESREEAWQALDLRQVTLTGEFGRRVQNIVEADILRVDVERTFLADFKKRGRVGYTGVGKFIDALVRLAVATGDERLRTLKTNVVAEILATQEPDGYIGIIDDVNARVRAIWDLHEGAYLIWGLVSDYRHFGERASLDAAQRLADYFLARFAAEPTLEPDSLGIMSFKVTSIGLDRALVALSEATSQAKYRDFVINFMGLNDYDPAIEVGLASAASHAYSDLARCLGQLDLYRVSGDARLLQFTRRVLTFLLKGDGLLVTGSCSHWECWHDNQSGLENTSETCASVYLAMLMDALLQVEGDSLYGDIMERDVYNALFAATSPDGSLTRYHTPFDGKRHYDTVDLPKCCTNNNKRFLADLRTWIYYRTSNGIAVNLYNSSTATLSISQGLTLKLEQKTDYPRSGDVLLKIDPSREGNFEIKLRIPRWCKQASVSINGSKTTTVSGGQFYGITRQWKQGDLIHLKMPMTWRFVRGRRSQLGRAAILRGPVIYTFNADRNPDLCAGADFEPRLIKINPLEVEPPEPDDSVCPGGLACRIKVWPPSNVNPWPFTERVPMVLTEYPDPKGEAIYFLTPIPNLPVLTDDELIRSP